MANKVNPVPSLPTPVQISKFADITTYFTQLINSLSSELVSHASRINNSFPEDGTENVLVAPKSSLPAPVAGGIIYVPDDTGGAVLAFSDGTNWRRVTDRAIIS